MNYLEKLENLTKEILLDNINYLTLKDQLEDYKLLLLKLSGLILEEESNKKDIQFENGIALGTTWAALCISDIIRTRQFLRGVFAAVKDLYEKKIKPIRILYTGTGPFATLILPLITKYSPEDLQLILLEVNPKTITHLKQVIKAFKMEDYVEKIVCHDATKYKINQNTKIDLLISETMQHALVKEQQVPIMLNLANQLNKDTIIIPNNIQLDLALMNTCTQLNFVDTKNEKYKVLTNLLMFNKNYMNSYAKQTEASNKKGEIVFGKQINFRKKNKPIYDKLVILTTIQIYKDEWIKIDSSGLTVPKILFDLNSLNKKKKEITITYCMNGNPEFKYELN